MTFESQISNFLTLAISARPKVRPFLGLKSTLKSSVRWDAIKQYSKPLLGFARTIPDRFDLLIVQYVSCNLVDMFPTAQGDTTLKKNMTTPTSNIPTTFHPQFLTDQPPFCDNHLDCLPLSSQVGHWRLSQPHQPWGVQQHPRLHPSGTRRRGFKKICWKFWIVSGPFVEEPPFLFDVMDWFLETFEVEKTIQVRWSMKKDWGL